jgi:hypothetical protein
MAGRVSALAVLGLEPGADAAAIEQAYKRLIKQHHPDREGGDSTRAAEINRAYHELQGGKAASDPLQFNDNLAAGWTRTRWPIALCSRWLRPRADFFRGRGLVERSGSGMREHGYRFTGRPRLRLPPIRSPVSCTLTKSTPR